MSETKKRNIFHMPHAYAFTVILILVCGVLTHIIPTGVYDLVEVNGRMVVDPETFHYLEEQTPLSMLVFSVFGQINIVTPIITFIPLGMLLAKGLGGDTLVALCLVPLANITSYATGAFSMSITGVAQDICQLPIYSAAGFRLVCMVVFIAVNSIWVIHYIKTIRKDPAKSLLYGTDAAMQDDNAELPELTFRRKLAVAIFVTGVIVLIYGSTHGWDSYTELPMIMVMPASGFLMASLGMAGVKYEAWMKFYFKYFILQALVACGLLAIANFMGLGPF